MSTTDTLDKASALKRLMNNESLYDKLVILFTSQIDDVKTKLAEFRELPPETLRFSLHTLKGSAGEIGAEALHSELARVENIVKTTPESISEEDIRAVEHEINRLMIELATPDG